MTRHIKQKKCLEILGWMKCLGISCRILRIRDACKITVWTKKIEGYAGSIKQHIKNYPGTEHYIKKI